MVNRSLFVSSMFNGTFSTNRLYRAIGVLSGKYDTTGRGRGILFWPNYRPHSLLALAGFNSFKFIRSDVDICTSFTHKIATAAHNPSGEGFKRTPLRAAGVITAWCWTLAPTSHTASQARAE